MSVRFRPVWHAMHVRASLVGREWIGVVAVLCLAFTTALTALLHAGVAALDGALRQELGGELEDVVYVEGAAGVPEGESRVALTALVRTLGEVRRSPVLRGMAVLRAQPDERHVEVLGVSAALPRLQPMAFREGRWFSAREEHDAKRVAVLGRALVDSVYRGIAPRRIRLAGATLEVIGVAESGAVAPITVDRTIMVTPGVLKRLVPAVGGPSAMLVAVSSHANGADARETWRALERRYGWFAGRLSLVSSRERLGDAGRLADALHVGASGLSSVLVGASLVAVSALMLTIARGHARTVGITRALGASRTQVVVQGLLIGALTGAIGVGSGLVVAAAIMPGIPLVFDVPAIPIGTLLRVLVKAGSLPLVMATGVSVACFVRLSRRAPAELLA